MCMQDLVINARSTIRKAGGVTLLAIGGDQYSSLPPSPLRIAAWAFDPATAGSPSIQVRFDGGAPVPLPPQLGGGNTLSWASVFQIPGIFNDYVYAADGDGSVVWYEVVMDSDLSSEVQRMSNTLNRIPA